MLGQPRTTQRRARKVASDEGALRGDIVRLASRFGRYGYRRVTDMLRIEGWGVNHKRVERIWRQEGLKVPQRQPKRGRLWLNDGSCIRLRPLYRGHVWSYDFVASRTHDGRALKLLTVLDEHTRECLAIVVARKIRAHDVLEVLADLFVRHGPPEYLRSDNGPEFTAKLVRRWLGSTVTDCSAKNALCEATGQKLTGGATVPAPVTTSRSQCASTPWPNYTRSTGPRFPTPRRSSRQ